MTNNFGELAVRLTTVWWLQKILSVRKRAEQKLDTERFNFKQLNDAAGQVKISNRFAGLKHFDDDDDDDDDVDISRTWENIRDNIKTSATEILGYYEFKQR
jgi:hypothetical protein